MSTGQAQEAARHRKKTIGLIALTSEAGRVSVSYEISAKVSARTRRQIVTKLQRVLDALKG